jgi:indolepyruvate ferredoxin oxidoreductase alpha subunit
VFARKNFKNLLSKQEILEKEAENSPYNQYFKGENKKTGLIVSGIAYNYVMENIRGQKLDYPMVKLSQYPIPGEMVDKLLKECEEVLVIEEGYPFIEDKLKGFQKGATPVKGKLDGTLPRTGELNPDHLARALGMKIGEGQPVPDIVVSRPPAMCQGCGHIEAYKALNEALRNYTKGRVFSDIGCYTLGALPPFETINSCVDMGASITMAKGAADAGLVPAVAVIGDSTFTHSGITGLLDCVVEKSPVTIIISDNFTTAMTGGQDSHALGRLERICEGVGVERDHIRVFRPTRKNMDEMISIMEEEIAYEGVSVIIPRRQCIQTLKDKKLKSKLKELGLK